MDWMFQLDLNSTPEHFLYTLWGNEKIKGVRFLQALLEVVNDLFEEQTDLEKIVRKIMQRALTLLQCERCSVLLLEDIHSPVRCSFIFRTNL